VKSSTAIRKNRSSASVAGFDLEGDGLKRLLLTSMGEIRRLLGARFSESQCESWDPMEMRSVHGIERFSPEEASCMIPRCVVLDNESADRVFRCRRCVFV